MSDELEARIRKIEDYQEISNLQAQYSYLIDSFQMEAVVDLFADDLVWESGFDTKSSVTSKPELLQMFKGAQKGCTMWRHQNSNPYIEVEGDNARGTWYVFGMITAVTPEGEVARWVQGKLDQEFVRVNGKWKFSRKSTEFNFLTPYEDGWVKTRNAGM